MKANIEKIETDKKLQILLEAYLKSEAVYERKALVQEYLKLKAEHPLQGCFVPPIEEFLILAHDLGHDERNDEYLPRFLSGLGNELLLSASENPGSDLILRFSGRSGGVGSGDRPYKTPVRCVCSTPAPQKGR